MWLQNTLKTLWGWADLQPEPRFQQSTVMFAPLKRHKGFSPAGLPGRITRQRRRSTNSAATFRNRCWVTSRHHPCLLPAETCSDGGRRGPAFPPLCALAILDPPSPTTFTCEEKDADKRQTERPNMWEWILWDIGLCMPILGPSKEALSHMKNMLWGHFLCVLNQVSSSWRDWGWSWKALTGAWYATSC